MRALTVVACAAQLAGGASTGRAQACEHGALPQDAHGAARAGLPADVDWPPWFYARADRVVALARLAPLDRRVLPPGEREARIWVEGPGMPSEMFRRVARGPRVTGEIVLYWDAPPPDAACGEPPGETMHDLMRYALPGRCGPIADGADMAMCRGRFTRAPDWRAALQALDADGLWTLPDRSTLPKRDFVVNDGWGIIVELRDGARYRAYAYDDPMFGGTGEEQRAARIGARLREIARLLRDPDVHRDYRGIYTGPVGPAARLDLDSTATFRACGASESWGVSGWIGELPALRDVVPAADSGARRPNERPRAPVRRLYVETRAQLSPAWLARRWASPFPRVLQLREVRVARPWTASGCPPRD